MTIKKTVVAFVATAMLLAGNPAAPAAAAALSLGTGRVAESANLRCTTYYMNGIPWYTFEKGAQQGKIPGHRIVMFARGDLPKGYWLQGGTGQYAGKRLGNVSFTTNSYGLKLYWRECK